MKKSNKFIVMASVIMIAIIGLHSCLPRKRLL